MGILERISPLELGGRLKAVRNAAKITQEGAATAIGVARTTLVAIEAGERQIRPSELAELAELYDVSVNSLLRESAVHFDLAPQFRRSTSARQDEDASAEAARVLQKLASVSVELESLLGKKWNAVGFPEYRISKLGWQDQAEDLAMEVRQRLGAGSRPIADIFVLAEIDLGIRVFMQQLPSKISGLFAYHEDVGACMLLNSVHPWERRAWTCAHEIGHFLTNRHSVDVSWVGGQERNIDERFADRFAAALLMPASVLRLRFSEIYDSVDKFSPRNLVILARTFNVSVEAMARRLEQLGLLLSGTYESLIERGFSVKAANELLGVADSSAQGFIPRLTWLALEAYQRDLLTEAQAVEMLGLDRLEVRRILASLLETSNGKEGRQNG